MTLSQALRPSGFADLGVFQTRNHWIKAMEDKWCETEAACSEVPSLIFVQHYSLHRMKSINWWSNLAIGWQKWWSSTGHIRQATFSVGNVCYCTAHILQLSVTTVSQWIKRCPWATSRRWRSRWLLRLSKNMVPLLVAVMQQYWGDTDKITHFLRDGLDNRFQVKLVMAHYLVCHITSVSRKKLPAGFFDRVSDLAIAWASLLLLQFWSHKSLKALHEANKS